MRAPGIVSCLAGLGRRSTDALRARTFRSLADSELYRVTFAQVFHPLTNDSAAVEKIILPRVVLDESKPFFKLQSRNCSGHRRLRKLTIISREPQRRTPSLFRTSEITLGKHLYGEQRAAPRQV